MSAADATATTAAAAVVAPATPFTTSFLRDGATGKSYAIIHFNEQILSVNFTVYERQSASAISTSSLSGSSTNGTGATIVFPITKGSTYFVIATTPSGESLSWTVDPNKRRVGGGASASKKRTAEGEPVAAPKDEAPATSAAPAAAAAAPATSAAAAPKEKKEKSAPAAKEPKEKKSKATA